MIDLILKWLLKSKRRRMVNLELHTCLTSLAWTHKTFMKHLCSALTIRKTLLKFLRRVEACCIPEANVIYEHCMSCIQESWETIDHHITDVIKLAENSWYGGLCDDLIRDKLVSGIRDDKVRVKLLGAKSLKLDQTIEVSRQTKPWNCEWRICSV